MTTSGSIDRMVNTSVSDASVSQLQSTAKTKVSLSVLVADDHPLIRDSLRQLLASEPSIGLVGESRTGRETVSQLKDRHWDLLILDINLPDASGIDILTQTRSSHPDLPVLVLSGFPEKQYAINVLRAGAQGFINKDCAPEELLSAVQNVLRGRRYVSAHLAQQLLDHTQDDQTKPLHARLSEREFQIFRKLAGGQTVSEIANELRISIKTVSTYRSRVLEKMQFESNADLTGYALRNQLL